jgi:SsrA-binding protein
MLLLKNKRAYFDYEILHTFEAGIKLLGCEVKSLKNKQVSFAGSYIGIQDGEIFVKNLNIVKYQFATIKDYDPLRARKLLLNKKEIAQIEKELKTRGVTVIPLEIFLKNNLLKIKIGLCRGKKKYDKRENLKKKDLERENKRKYGV